MTPILFFINSLRSGGAEKVCVNLANGFYERGHAVRLLVLNLDDARYRDDLHADIKLLSLNSVHARSSIFKAIRFLHRDNPVKILVFNHQLAILLVLIRMLPGMNYTIVARNISNLVHKRRQEKSFWHKYIVGTMVKMLYNKVDRVIAQSSGMKRELVQSYGFSDNKIDVIHNPVSLAFEQQVSEAAGGQKKEILYIGRLTRIKGLYYLLDAFRIFHGRNPDFILNIVGEGELLGALQSKVKQYGLSDSVYFCGYQKNTISYYRAAAMTVLTSFYEGLPNVLIESITLGVPVVAFNCPNGPLEIVDEGRNGYLIPFGNVAMFAEKMASLVTRPLDATVVRHTSYKFARDAIISRYEKNSAGINNGTGGICFTRLHHSHC